MKKILSLLLVLVVGVSLFTGCSKDKVSSGTGTKTELEGVITDPNERISNAEKVRKEAVEKALEGKSIEDTSKENSKRSPRYVNIKGDIKEQIAYNENDIKITAKGFNFEKVDPKFILEVENKRADNVYFKIEKVAINGFMLDATISEIIYPGEPQEVAITFLDASILSNRIETIEDLAFTINFREGETKFSTGEIVLKTGLTAEEYPEIANGQTVFNTNGVKIVYLDMKYGSEKMDTTLYFYIENNTENEIGFVTDDREATINGKDVDITFAHAIDPNRKYIDGLTITDRKLAEKDISVIDTLEIDDFICINEDNHSRLFEGGFLLENLSETIIE